MASSAVALDLSCAVEVFVATALLHKEQPQREDFTIQEIVNRVAQENLTGILRSGINVHASQHCVANRSPNPARHRMLYATGKHTRRLLLPGDDIHPARTGKLFPDGSELPAQYLPLLDWARERYKTQVGTGSAQGRTTLAAPEQGAWLDEILKLRLAGAHLADGTDPDDYVRQLREGWD